MTKVFLLSFGFATLLPAALILRLDDWKDAVSIYSSIMYSVGPFGGCILFSICVAFMFQKRTHKL